MNLIFCGTPEFAVPSLERLVMMDHNVMLVVTQPDRARGRGMIMTAPPVKQAARRLDVPVIQPEKIKKNEEFQRQIAGLHPDAIIVVGYGRIIPPWMLELPAHGNINVHASLLPKYRGAAPIQWAIASGETVTGVTTMRLDEGLDTGDILLRRELAIDPDDVSVTLSLRLAEVGADLLIETLSGLEQGSIRRIPQDNALATLAPILKKEDGLIDFRRTAPEIHNRLRGFQPWPGAYTLFRGKSLKIIAALPVAQAPPVSAGELDIQSYGAGERLLAGCGAGTALDLVLVQPEGKKPITADEFIRGYRPAQAERLG